MQNVHFLSSLISMLGLGSIATFILGFLITGKPLDALVLTIAFDIVVFVVGLVRAILDSMRIHISDRIARAIINGIDKRFLFANYRKKYLQHLAYQYRFFDVRGLSVQGEFNLDLDQVYVELMLAPAESSHEKWANPFGNT